MIDFTTLQGLTIPEGVVTQITDESGRVIWAVQSGEPIVLEVEKITSDTYAGETTYTGEQFILLDIYPKTNGTVKVTYGGLTKTITDTSGAASPNAQQVFFGTFNGVTDEVATPASGTLTIEGDYAAFGITQFQFSSKSLNWEYCSCITAVTEWGTPEYIPGHAFTNCNKLNISEIPEGVTKIGSYAFQMSAINDKADTAMSGGILTIPSTVQSIGSYAFVYSYTTASGDGATLTYHKEIRMLSTIPPTITTTTFGAAGHSLGNTDWVVPKGYGEIYKSASVWSDYKLGITETS